MTYNVSNYNELNKLYFHDYALANISVDYSAKLMKLYMQDEQNTMHELNIRFYFFSIECFEPWGEGVYINSHTISLKKEKSEYIAIDFLLNSGDKLSIMAKEVAII